MKIEREQLSNRDPIIRSQNSVTIGEQYMDSYGHHLNQALSLKIFEEERLRIMEERGLPPERMLAEFGVLAFIREQHARYHQQVYEGEDVDIKTSVYLDGARIIFSQVMERQGAVVIDTLVEAATVNTDGRPTRIPSGLITALRELTPS